MSLYLVPTPVDTDRLAVSLLSEARAASASGDRDRMTGVILAAIDLDQANPGQPRLMDEIRGLRYDAAA
jgi:hypothetical protein